ncbi:hypothetical protein ACEYYA_02625 [Paracoccus sp. p3-h83]|uniref:hypothetical protein n=1 Tax=Paracoccus sp. p3-h83 TaxID=3342805 RepID=UPI0035B7ABC1
MTTRITYTVTESKRWRWRFEDLRGQPINFGGAQLVAELSADGACIAVPVQAGPDSAAGLAEGDCALLLTPETVTVPPRRWPYPIRLWVTWSNGDRQCLDDGTIMIRERCSNG